jgi:predicted lipoprotein with Yx(FWY)xxD motif
MHKKKSLFCAAPVVAALAIAGCGGGGAGATPSAAASSNAPAKITVRHDKLGSYLADARGRALYLFEADTGSTSNCYSACASLWPPLASATAITPSAGVARTLLGTTKRKDGTSEVTYDGHPLYLYAGDMSAGAINGQGLNQFGAKWYLVAPNGRKIDDDGH